MMNYIVRYSGELVPDVLAVKNILQNSNITILDSTPQMMLVAAINEQIMDAVKKKLPAGWNLVGQEKKYQVPDTRRKVNKKEDKPKTEKQKDGKK